MCLCYYNKELISGTSPHCHGHGHSSKGSVTYLQYSDLVEWRPMEQKLISCMLLTCMGWQLGQPICKANWSSCLRQKVGGGHPSRFSSFFNPGGRRRRKSETEQKRKCGGKRSAELQHWRVVGSEIGSSSSKVGNIWHATTNIRKKWFLIIIWVTEKPPSAGLQCTQASTTIGIR